MRCGWGRPDTMSDSISLESLILLALPARLFSPEETRMGAIEIPMLQTLWSPGIFRPLLNTIVWNHENQISLTVLILFYNTASMAFICFFLQTASSLPTQDLSDDFGKASHHCHLCIMWQVWSSSKHPQEYQTNTETEPGEVLVSLMQVFQ